MRQRFLEAADTIVELAAEDGFTVRPYLDRELPVFSSLAPAEAGYALTRIETMVGVCKFARARGERLQDSRAMLACYLEVSGSTTEPGVLDQIEDDHTLEIYSTDHKLVFAALKSLDVTSYSLEEIYCRPWTELLSRDVPGISEALYQVAITFVAKRSRLRGAQSSFFIGSSRRCGAIRR